VNKIMGSASRLEHGISNRKPTCLEPRGADNVRDCNVYGLCPGVRGVVLLCDDVYLKGSGPGRLQSI